MTPVPPTSTLDFILGLQLSVAWAGETTEPARLSWWKTDLVDEASGGDLFARLLPRTHEWAGLQAAREAAIRTDVAARARMSDPDTIRSLFHFGFEADERLHERLVHHKRSGTRPSAALSNLIALDEAFSTDALAALLKRSADEEFKVVPGGRQLKGAPPASLELCASRLAAALLPVPAQYPLPFFRAE